MLLANLSAIVCLIGLLIYLFVDHPKVNTIGHDMFWVGLLAFLIGGPGKI